MHAQESSTRTARRMIDSVAKGKDPHKTVLEMIASEDDIAACVGVGSGEAASKLSALGFKSTTSKDFTSGSIAVFTQDNPENPGEIARVYLATGSDGTVKLAQNDATANLTPEALDTAMLNMATQLGFTRPEGSTAQPGDGGVGTVAGQA